MTCEWQISEIDPVSLVINFVYMQSSQIPGQVQPNSMDIAKKTELAKLMLIERFPGSIEMANYHKQANRFGLASNRQVEICPCCDERIDNTPYPICMSTSHPDLPAGIALYFQFVKMVISYLIFRFVLADGYNLLTNFRGNDCGNL